MGNLIRFVAVFLVLAPFTAMFSEPFFEAIFDGLGWDTESWAGPFVQFTMELTAFVLKPDVLYASYVLGAIGFGVWLHWLATRVDSKRPSKADRFSSLSSMIYNVRNEILNGSKNGVGEVDFTSRNRKSELRLRALYSELRSLGLSPPNYDREGNQAFNIGHYSYLQTLEPFAERGNIAEAKRQEKLAKAEFKSAISDLQAK